MTPQFTTPCYVRIEDADKRKEICQQLEQIGYEMSELTRKHLEKISEFWQVSTSPRSRQIHVTSELGAVHKVVGRVDCGTNTELFLALAGMRSDTDEGQWFVAQSNILFKKLKREVVTANKKRYITIGEMFMPLTHNLRFTWFGGNSKQLFRLATATEIIEHFNTKTK